MKNNTSMTAATEQQLKQDGNTIKQLAASRLQEWDVSQSVLQGIKQQQTQAKTPKTFWYGMAAAAVLTTLLWTFNTGEQQAVIQPPPAQQLSAEHIGFDLKQLPLTLEQKVNQPLLDEQQAIIEDLKNLKVQLLSI